MRKPPPQVYKGPDVDEVVDVTQSTIERKLFSNFSQHLGSCAPAVKAVSGSGTLAVKPVPSVCDPTEEIGIEEFITSLDHVVGCGAILDTIFGDGELHPEEQAIAVTYANNPNQSSPNAEMQARLPNIFASSNPNRGRYATVYREIEQEMTEWEAARQARLQRGLVDAELREIRNRVQTHGRTIVPVPTTLLPSNQTALTGYLSHRMPNGTLNGAATYEELQQNLLTLADDYDALQRALSSVVNELKFVPYGANLGWNDDRRMQLVKWAMRVRYSGVRVRRSIIMDNTLEVLDRKHFNSTVYEMVSARLTARYADGPLDKSATYNPANGPPTVWGNGGNNIVTRIDALSERARQARLAFSNVANTVRDTIARAVHDYDKTFVYTMHSLRREEFVRMIQAVSNAYTSGYNGRDRHPFEKMFGYQNAGVQEQRRVMAKHAAGRALALRFHTVWQAVRGGTTQTTPTRAEREAWTAQGWKEACFPVDAGNVLKAGGTAHRAMGAAAMPAHDVANRNLQPADDLTMSFIPFMHNLPNETRPLRWRVPYYDQIYVHIPKGLILRNIPVFPSDANLPNMIASVEQATGALRSTWKDMIFVFQYDFSRLMTIYSADVELPRMPADAANIHGPTDHASNQEPTRPLRRREDPNNLSAYTGGNGPPAGLPQTANAQRTADNNADMHHRVNQDTDRPLLPGGVVPDMPDVDPAHPRQFVARPNGNQNSHDAVPYNLVWRDARAQNPIPPVVNVR